MEPIEKVEQRIERETSALELALRGDTAITVGKVLLWVDLILVCFVEVGFRTGSYIFLWWSVCQGVLGLILVGVGMHQKSEAEKTLDMMAPR